MTLTYHPAFEVLTADLAALFTDAFTGYIGGQVNMTAPLLSGMIAQNGIDLGLSLIAYDENTPVGFGMIARQGWTSRVVVMGIAQQAQGKQVGTRLMSELITQARARGDHFVELEAFEQNTRAVKLYEKAGFRVLRRLTAYTLEHSHGQADPALTPIDIFDAARRVSANGIADLPWQVSGSHLIRMAFPNRAYQLDQACAIITDPAQEVIAVRALIVEPSHRGAGQAARLMRALWAQFPGKQWRVPALCPEAYGGFFEKIGFTRQELNQVQMRLDLNPV